MECLGKIKTPITNFTGYDIAGQLNKPIKLFNFDVMPDKTLLENNDHYIVIRMEYNSNNMPIIDFQTPILGSYQFEFIYFQWFDRNTWEVPIELHAVFYSSDIDGNRNTTKDQYMALAYGLKVNILNYYNKIKKK